MKKYLLLIIISFIFAFNVCESYASDEAKFSLVANTPTNVTVPVNRNTYVQYEVTNNTTITRRLTMVPIPNVVQVTRDNSQCTNPFVLSSGQSCKLTLYIDGQQIKSNYSGGPVVCKTKATSNQPDPFLCSQPSSSMILSIKPAPAINNPTNKLYVSNWDGNSISLCYIQSGNISHCLVSAVGKTFANPEALAINDNVLFVANIAGGISSCAINATTGGLSNCINAASVTDPIYAPDGISIHTDGGDTYAYIANSGPEQFHQGVTVCNVSGQLLSNCTFTQGDATFSVPSDLAINDNTLYITNFNSNTIQTTYCTIPVTPTSICTTAEGEGVISGTSNLLNEPEGISFANINGTNYAYFTNHGNNTVTLCQVTSPTNFTGCFNTQGYFSGFGNLAILNNPPKAFIPSGLKSIAVCDVHSDGSLSNCANSTELNFNNPSGLIIQ
jgi:hypothetical protein